jgi:hypothetical protein
MRFDPASAKLPEGLMELMGRNVKMDGTPKKERA